MHVPTHVYVCMCMPAQGGVLGRVLGELKGEGSSKIIWSADFQPEILKLFLVF